MKTSFSLALLFSAILSSHAVSAWEPVELDALPEAGAPPADCTGTFSGALQGTFRCVMVAVYGFAPGVGAVSFTPAVMPAGVQSVTASFQLPGEPMAGSFPFESCKDCMASVSLNNGTLYMAQKKSPTAGSTSMILSSATRVFATPDGSVYTVHGTIDAEMPSNKPGTQEARMHVEF